jgi:hypothetical protein
MRSKPIVFLVVLAVVFAATVAVLSVGAQDKTIQTAEEA